MSHLRWLGWPSVTLAAVMWAGCGDSASSSSPPADSGKLAPDSGIGDAARPPDGSLPEGGAGDASGGDAGTDAPVNDAGGTDAPVNDAGGTDASVNDTGTDAPVNDAGNPTGSDGGDAGSDAGNPTEGDAGTDAGNPSGGDAGAGDASTACVSGVSVCGRGPLGVQCAVATHGSFGALGPPQAEFADSDGGTGWNSQPCYFGTIRFPDVNGDGLPDVCGRRADGVVCALSTGGTSFGPLQVWQADFRDDLGWNTSDTYWATLAFPDVDGDGRADVCARGPLGVLCAVSDGSSFGETSIWDANFSDQGGWNDEFYGLSIQFPDVNGDGKADLCGRGSGGIVCSVSDGSKFTSFGIWQPDYSDGNGWGDALDYFGTIQFPDLDGDHKADVCGREADGIRCATSNGASFGVSSVWVADYGDSQGWAEQASYWSTIQFPDLDGDGRADVCGRGDTSLRCALAAPTGRAFNATIPASFSFTNAAGFGVASAYAPIQYPDIDGDGKNDVCAILDAGLDCALSNGDGTFGPLTPSPTTFTGWGAESSWGTIQFTRSGNSTCGLPYRPAPPRPTLLRLGGDTGGTQ